MGTGIDSTSKAVMGINELLCIKYLSAIVEISSKEPRIPENNSTRIFTKQILS